MPTNINIRDISLEYDESLRGKANSKPPIIGELIEVGGSVEVEGRPQYVWYKPMGGSQPKQVLNRTVVPKNGLPVVVGISFEDDSTEEEILDLDMSMAGRLDIASARNIPHSDEHQPGGGDMLWVDPKQILEFAVYPASGLSFSVASGYYNSGNQTIRFAGITSVDISGSQPAATQHIAVGVYLDIATNLIGTVDGTAVLIGARISSPTWPTNSMPLSIIDLDGVQTTLSFALDIISVKGTLSDSIWKRGSGGDIYYDDGGVGIGTATVPHGGIGWAKLALEGADWDADGPHIQLTTDTDNYPVMQIFGGTHEEQGIFFDSYYDGDNRSSYSGGNFQILNKSGRLRFRYDTGVAAGATITWKEGITLRDTGRIGFGTISPSAHVESVSATLAQLRLSYLYLTKFADFTVDTNHHLTIDPSSTGQIKLNATVTVIDEVQHEGGADTKWGFTTNQWDLTVGGINMIRADETAQDVLYLGDVGGGGDVDIDFNSSQMFLDGSNESLAIGTTDTTFVVTASVTKTRLFIEAPDESRFFGFVLLKESDSRSTANAILRARAGAAAVQDNDVLGAIQFMGHDGTDYERSVGIQAEVDGAVSADTVPGALYFQTTETNSLEKRVKIGPTGNMSVGWETDNVRLSVANTGINTTPLLPGDFLPSSISAEPEVVLGLVNENASGNYVAMAFQVRTSSTPGAVLGLERTADFQGDLFLQIRNASGTSPEIMRWRHNGQVQITSGELEFNEIAAPGAGAANTARLFSRDDGSGNTELCVRFNTGLIQVIAPLEFGEISRLENAVATALTVTTPAQYLFFDTNGVFNGATPDHTNDHITVNKAGTYLITCSITAASVGGGAVKMEFTVLKNNGATQVGALHADRNLAGGGGDVGSISLSGLAVLTSGDTIELWLENETNNNDIVVEDAILSIAMVGVNT